MREEGGWVLKGKTFFQRSKTMVEKTGFMLSLENELSRCIDLNGNNEMWGRYWVSNKLMRYEMAKRPKNY